MMEESSLCILVLNNHYIERKGIEVILKANYLNSLIFCAKNITESFEMLNMMKFDIIILDVNVFTDEKLSVLNTFKKWNPKIKVLIYSLNEEDRFIINCFNAGANGFVDKLCSEKEIVDSINAVLTKGYYFDSKINKQINRIKNKQVKNLELSDREHEIAMFLIKGYKNIDICKKLGIKMSTVSTFKRRIFEKYGIYNVIELSIIYKSIQN